MKGKQGKKRRQRSALEIRQAQLEKGMKFEKIDGRTTNKQIPLTDGDRTRMKKEIEVLEKRLVS